MATGHPRLVILAVDRLTLADLQTRPLPNLQRLMEQGAVGLMTTRSIGGLSPEKIYLSIGAGEAMTTGTDADGLVFDADETYQGLRAADAYRLQQGKDPGSASLLHLGLAGLAKANASLPGRCGWLGEALARQGWRLAVLGNADDSAGFGREAASFLMDREGRVALGHIGVDTLLRDWRVPGGARTDYAVLRRDYDQLRDRADAILIALGDLARIQAAGTSLAPSQAARHQMAALHRIDQFLGFIVSGRNRPERIILLVASAPVTRLAAGERLTPLVIWGDGIRPGLASSASTRQPGVVTPYDVTATIARQAGLEPGLMTLGQPLVTHPGTPSSLPRYYAELVRNFQQRAPVFQSYGYALFLAAIAALGLSVRGRGGTGLARFLRSLLLGLALVPTLLLLLGLAPLGPVWLTMLAAGLSAVLAGLLFRRLWADELSRLAMAGLLTAAVIIADVLLGSPLLRRSLLGYSPVFGARFYGLGNEYLGVTLGAIILGGAALAALYPRRGKLVLAAIFALTTLVIALPRYGANVGGGISALVGLGYTYCLLTGRRVGWREGMGLALGVCGLLAFLIFYDLWGLRAHPSHLGQAVLRLRHEGPQVAFLIVRSKLLMNVRLLAYTSWTWVMLGLLVLAPVALCHPPEWLGKRLPLGTPLTSGIQGMLVTALVGLLVNDSGVVVAATIVIYVGLLFVHVFRGQEFAERGGAVRI